MNCPHRFCASIGLLALVCAPAAVKAGVVIAPTAGFSVTWDGNDGVGFNPASPAPVGANLANAGGAAAFTASDLGPQLGITFHVATNLTDGLYGNSNSWIGGDGAPIPYAAVRLGGAFNLTGFAFGRDNGNGDFDDDPAGTDACGGQCDDRSLGIYTLQITSVAVPDGTTADTGNSATGWQTIGTLNYQSSDDLAPGGAFTSYFRHEYAIAAGGGAVPATGFRMLVPATGLGPGTAIDEIEIFGSPVPEPTTGLSLLAALGALSFRRRRR